MEHRPGTDPESVLAIRHAVENDEVSQKRMYPNRALRRVTCCQRGATVQRAAAPESCKSELLWLVPVETLTKIGSLLHEAARSTRVSRSHVVTSAAGQ